MGKIKTEVLSQLVKNKRGKDGLRETAKKIGVSAPTLSRIEQGRVPDLETYLTLCDWLEVSTEYFVKEAESKYDSKRHEVVAHLRADKTLDNEVSNALIKMIDIAYENL